MATQKEAIEKLVNIMKKWQVIEDESVKMTTEIIKKTDNPLVHLVMEIIRQDSVMHRRVQQLLVDHFEKQPITLNPDELLVFWDLVEKHELMEKKTIELANEALGETKSSFAHYLISYLLKDEKKHDDLLEDMSKLKEGMYPYSGM